MNNIDDILTRIRRNYGAFPGTQSERLVARHLHFESLYEGRGELGLALDDIYLKLTSEPNPLIAEGFFGFLREHAIVLQKGISLEMRVNNQANPAWSEELGEIKGSRIWRERVERKSRVQTWETTQKIEAATFFRSSEDHSFEQMKIEDWRVLLSEELTVELIFYIINRQLSEELVAGVYGRPFKGMDLFLQ